jgi:hypothetical protein
MPGDLVNRCLVEIEKAIDVEDLAWEASADLFFCSRLGLRCLQYGGFFGGAI